MQNCSGVLDGEGVADGVRLEDCVPEIVILEDCVPDIVILEDGVAVDVSLLLAEADVVILTDEDAV